jgi:Flp pilus assembly pilin Flp
MLEFLTAKYIMFISGIMETDEEGQTAVEYALVLLLVALVLVAALALGLTGALGNAINRIKNSIG